MTVLLVDESKDARFSTANGLQPVLAQRSQSSTPCLCLFVCAAVVFLQSGCASLDQFGERSDFIETSEFESYSSDAFADGTPEAALLETYDEFGPPSWFAFSPPAPPQGSAGETTFRVDTPRFLPVPVRPAFFPQGKSSNGYIPPETKSPVIVTPAPSMQPKTEMLGPLLQPPGMAFPGEPPALQQPKPPKTPSTPPVPPLEIEENGETLPLPAPRDVTPMPSSPKATRANPLPDEPSPFELDGDGDQPAILMPPNEGSTQLQWRRRRSRPEQPGELEQTEHSLVGHQE